MEKMTRRDLLKAIIAGSGGIVAAGFLPEKWLKPVVKSGVLPVHAQASAPTPAPTQVPTQTPDYIQGGYEDFDGDSDYLRAFAYVSSQPFPENTTGINASSLTKVQVVANPVEGKDVTLYVYEDDNKSEISTKKTDANGYVEWDLEWDLEWNFSNINSIDPTKEIVLNFVMIDGEDSVIYSGYYSQQPS